MGHPFFAEVSCDIILKIFPGIAFAYLEELLQELFQRMPSEFLQKLYKFV